MHDFSGMADAGGMGYPPSPLIGPWPRVFGCGAGVFNTAYKSASSRLLKQEFPQIRQKLWKEYFWSRSFCLLTTGGAPIEVIRKYIENQGRK